MKKVTVSPQAQSFYGSVEVTKADVQDLCDAKFASVQNSLGKVPQKGFRPRKRTRDEAEQAIGADKLYADVWRNVFIECINAQNADTRVCFADELEVTDRGPHYEIGGMFFFFPRVDISQVCFTELQKEEKDWFLKQIVSEQALESRIGQVMRNHIKKVDSVIKKGYFVKVLVDSDVNKSHPGSKPVQALWHLDDGKVQPIVLESLLGRQAGQRVIVPISRPEGEPMRAQASIMEVYAPDYESLDDLAVKEGLVDSAALELRERRTLESLYETNKDTYFFRYLLANSRISPIPGSFVFRITERRVQLLKQEMGAREFSKKYGASIEDAISRHLNEVREHVALEFICHALAKRLGFSPTDEEIQRLFEFDKAPFNRDMEVEALLLLSREKVLHHFLGIEPPSRTLVQPADSSLVRLH